MESKICFNGGPTNIWIYIFRFNISINVLLYPLIEVLKPFLKNIFRIFSDSIPIDLSFFDYLNWGKFLRRRFLFAKKKKNYDVLPFYKNVTYFNRFPNVTDEYFINDIFIY